MKRLFKEVWRSLFKNNKVVVAGLTILIFLTSGIFTLLNDTYQSMSRQYNSYKLKSKTHDLTVDFNLNANGNAYNNGYYINGLTQNDSHIDYDKALRYVSVDQNGEPNFKQNYKIIDFNVLQNQEYLNLSNFFSSPEEKEKFASQYIKTSDLLTLYSNYNNEKDTLEEQPLLNLEFTDQGQQIVLKNHYLINSYVKENGKYSLNINSRTLNNSSASVFAFDKTYKLSDLVSINNENDFIVISQVPEMYINLSESNPIATFDLIKARKWKEENKLIYTLNSKSVAGALGFLPKNGADDKFRRIINQSGDYGLINFDENDTLENIYEKSLKNLFSYSNVFNSNEITASAPQQFEFEANKKYHIPYEWTALQENYTFYTRKHYRLTYDNFHKKDWTGTYLSFIENLEKNNEITPEMVQFSLWTKLHKSYIRNYDSQGNLSSLKELNDLESNSIVSYDEANQVNLRFAEPQYQEISPQTLDRKILKVSNENISLTTSINDFYYLENPQTIARIETYGPTLTLKQYNDISNRNIRNEKFDFIKNGALKITKQNIYNQIAEKVGRENIGIRQSITVDSFNNNEKYVFHLVNTGNSDAEINGIKNNLNKLTSDEKDFSIYGNKIDAEQVFNSKQIPPFVSKTIIAQAKSNVSPDPEYINIDLTYSDVRFFDYDTKELQILSGKKIYKLSKYGYDLEPNFANLGVTWNGNKLILIHPVYKDGTQEISYWENTSLKINKNGEITIDEFFNLINSDNNQLTIKAEIGKDGWIAKSDIYSNWLYVPFGYRGPDSEVVLEATNFNTLNKALEKVEKNLLETTLIKDGFITKDVLYNFQKSFAIAAEKNNFASIFSEGSVNLNIVPKLILDTLYEMTHSSNGDYINKMLVSILTRIKQKILENPKDKQKEYLVQQFEKFDNFMKVAIGDLAQYPINWASFINLVKDPVVVLDNLINLVNAIDIKRFTDFTNDFFTNEYNKYFDINGNRLTDEYVQEHPNELAYQRKFSYHEMILWFLQSINWDNFKQALMNIIDNVNLSFILDINNSNNPFSYLLKSLPFNIEAILRQVDENPNLSGLHYQNIIRGIKELINVFDLNVFINLVNERIKTDRFDLQEKIFDETFNTDVTLNRHYILKYLTQTDWIYSLLKTFFNVPNSNKQIKQILINMFNLSSKGTSIKLDKDTYLTIPTADHDKLDYFDLLSLTAQKNQAEQNDNDVNSFMNLANVIEKIKDLDSVKLNDLSKGDRQTLNLFFGWKLVDDQNNEIIYSKEEIKKKINIWTKILAFVQYHGNDENLAPQMSISDLFAYFINNTDTSNNVLFYSIVQKALGLFDKFNASNKYSYLKPAYSLTSLFFKAMQLDLPMVAKIEFLNSLIALANNPELLKEVNSFDLSEANSKNIVAASDSGFGVTYSLAYPEKFSNRLFTEQNASKAQNLVHDWIS
ncbi:hypothetical protein, partial [Mycoplasma buteonis]|uniref:hypothetical protein n=1 Tax=Mycoplasma buteonis TaxID=171280 RepID=UPI00055CF2BD